MKKYSPVYSKESIIYWPSFAGGVSFLCFGGFTLLMYSIILILLFNDGNVAYETICGMVFASALLVLWLIFAITIAIKSMFCCITITTEGFSIINKFKARDTHILWRDVSWIEFKQENYRGRKQYLVHLKIVKQEQCVAIPISMVSEAKLCSMIPRELLIGRPGNDSLS